MTTLSKIFMIGALLVLMIFSFGFKDPHLELFSYPPVVEMLTVLTAFVYGQPFAASVVYGAIVAALFCGYAIIMATYKASRPKAFPRWIVSLIALAVFSFPALSYDVFNYILTAKMTFYYQENPYIVMPIEIPNEPMLAYTRAANKVALYGPSWIALTSFPYIVGRTSVTAAIFSFKAFVALFYIALVYMIYRKTKRWDQAMFFALNPLIILEGLVSGHNDLVMMALAVAGLLLWHRASTHYKVAGIVLFTASVLVKGATIALLPLFIFSSWTWEKKIVWGYWLMFGIFLLSPLREELYPWYATWWLTFASFVPIRKNSFIHAFSFAVCVGLMLGYLPWIATREYGGITPAIRTMLTIVPPVVYVLYYFRHYFINRKRYYKKRA